MRTYNVTIGDLVSVSVPTARATRRNVKARLTGFDYYTGASGSQYLGAVVTYTSDSGEPFSVDRRHRGESEVMHFSRVTPRNAHPDEGSNCYHVVFTYDRSIPAYADTDPVAEHSHIHPAHAY